MRLDELVARLGGELIGDAAIEIVRVAPLHRAERGEIAFLSNQKFASQLEHCRASAVIVPPSARDNAVAARIVADDPYLYFARVAQLLNPPERPPAGIDASARVLSRLPDSVSVGPGAYIAEDAVLGEHVCIGPGCHVGRGTHIGAGTRLHANVSVYHDCRIGRDCIIHSGAVIGADGFGFAREKDGAWVKIPQTGRVVIGDDVEIGANTTIDRGALDDTVISNGVKIDNLVMVAHNVHIGEKTAVAGCVGIAGSARIGARCMLAGQAGISGHVEICDDVVVSACTLVAKSIKEPGIYTTSLPLQKRDDWVRNFSHLRHLDRMASKIRKLEKRLENDGAKQQ